MKNRQANIVLMRRLFFENATVGELFDPMGQQLCLTFEPAIAVPQHRPSGSSRGKAIPEGTYVLEYYYDCELSAFCFRVNRLRSIGTIRLRPFLGQAVFPVQTHGDILIGMHFDAEKGCLSDSNTALSILLKHHSHLRSIGQRPVLQVRSEAGPTTLCAVLGTPSQPAPAYDYNYNLLDY